MHPQLVLFRNTNLLAMPRTYNNIQVTTIVYVCPRRYSKLKSLAVVATDLLILCYLVSKLPLVLYRSKDTSSWWPRHVEKIAGFCLCWYCFYKAAMAPRLIQYSYHLVRQTVAGGC